MDGLVKPWRRVGDFNGRATRKEYWSAIIQLLLALVLFFVLFVAVAQATNSLIVMLPMSVLLFGFIVLAAVMNVSVSIRRIHDFDVTGWLVLALYIPYAGWIAMIVIGCIPGTQSHNRWGPDPRGGPSLQQVFS